MPIGDQDPVQSACLTKVQAPAAEQQGPAEQGLGSQVRAKVHCPVHADLSVTEHRPVVALQHAPLQGLGVQETLKVQVEPATVHCVLGTLVHTPVFGSQQAPGQEVAVHAVL